MFKATKQLSADLKLKMKVKLSLANLKRKKEGEYRKKLWENHANWRKLFYAWKSMLTRSWKQRIARSLSEGMLLLDLHHWNNALLQSHFVSFIKLPWIIIRLSLRTHGVNTAVNQVKEELFMEMKNYMTKS